MSISAETFFGRAAELSTAVTATIAVKYARCWSVTATAASRQIRLEVPAVAELREGFPLAYVYNVGATNAFDLADAAGNVIAAVPVGNVAAVGLVNSAGNGTWIADVGAV